MDQRFEAHAQARRKSRFVQSVRGVFGGIEMCGPDSDGYEGAESRTAKFQHEISEVVIGSEPVRIGLRERKTAKDQRVPGAGRLGFEQQPTRHTVVDSQPIGCGVVELDVSSILNRRTGWG